MTAEILPFDGVQRPRGKSVLSSVPPDFATSAFAFQRALIRIERETIGHIQAGRTFQAIFSAAALVPLASIARTLGPVCIARALATGERMKAALDASIIGDAGDPNPDDPS